VLAKEAYSDRINSGYEPMISKMYAAVKVSVRSLRLIFDRISACTLLCGSSADASEA
jgi:hypothetical protein